MKFVEGLEVNRRLCDYNRKNNIKCVKCQLYKISNIGCLHTLRHYPEEAEKALIDWDKAHPQKTILQDFLEKYPNAKLNKIGFPKGIRPHDLGYPIFSNDCSDHGCKKCWNSPYEEKENQND